MVYWASLPNFSRRPNNSQTGTQRMCLRDHEFQHRYLGDKVNEHCTHKTEAHKYAQSD